MIEILTGTELQHCVITHPLKDVYHATVLPAHSKLGSGQPISVHGSDQDTVLGLVFSAYTLDEDTLQDGYTAHAVDWSVYTTEAEAQEVADKVNENDFIILEVVKHPVNNEWAIAFSQAVFDAIPEGDNKTWLYNKSVESVNAGRRHDTQYMLDNGWV